MAVRTPARQLRLSRLPRAGKAGSSERERQRHSLLSIADGPFEAAVRRAPRRPLGQLLALLEVTCRQLGDVRQQGRAIFLTETSLAGQVHKLLFRDNDISEREHRSKRGHIPQVVLV